MHAYVYKSLARADPYLYLAARDDFARVPEPLRTRLGGLDFEWVLDLREGLAVQSGTKTGAGQKRGRNRKGNGAHVDPEYPWDERAVVALPMRRK